MHAEFRTLDEAVAWLQEQIAAYRRAKGQNAQFDFAINYHAPRTECDTPVNVLFFPKQ